MNMAKCSMDMQAFYEKINVVFSQWKIEEQCKYVDDFLLPKLTDIIKTMFLKNGDSIDFLHKTEFLPVCDFCFTNFISSSNLNVEILTFQIRALGVCSSSEASFLYMEKHSNILPLLSNICSKDFISYNFSIQSSILFCLKSLLEHSTGLRWLLQIEGIIGRVFKTFQAPSFHVREDGISFLSCLFISWYSENHEDDDELKELFNFLIRSLVLPSMKKPDVNSSVQNSSISLLRLFLKNNKGLRYLLCETHQLFEHIMKSIKSIVESCKSLNDFLNIETYPQATILLLAECYTYSQSNNSEVMDDFLQLLFLSPLMPSAMLLVTSLLIKMNEESHISRPQFNIVLWPFLKCLKMPIDGLPSKYHDRLNSMMSNSKERSVVLKTSLICCKKMLCSQNRKISEQIIEIITTFFTTLTSREEYADEWLCSTKKLSVFVIDLINLSTVINCNDVLKSSNDLISKLFIGLFCIFKVSDDPHILASCLTAIRNYMDCTGLCFVSFKEISEILVQELNNPHNFIVEGCLEIIHRLVVRCTGLQIPWINFLCSNKIFGAVWNIARNQLAESCVRAEAIQVLNAFYINSCLWNELLRLNTINNDEFISFVFKLEKYDDDAIMKAMLSIFPHLLASCSADSSHHCTMCSILRKIVRTSSDYECQVLALRMWQLIGDTVVASVSSLSDKNIAAFKIMQTLTENGYCLSLLDAVNDENLIVRGEAFQILLHFRKMIVNLQIIEQSFMSNVLDIDEVSCSKLQDYMTSQHSSFNEKNLAIDYVLNIPTSVKIKNNMVFKTVMALLKTEDSVVGESFITSREYLFWKYLWFDNLQEKLIFCNESCDPYEKNPISLLDDIIIARRETCEFNEGYLSIDCY